MKKKNYTKQKRKKKAERLQKEKNFLEELKEGVFLMAKPVKLKVGALESSLELEKVTHTALDLTEI